MNRGTIVFQTSLASKKMVWPSLSSDASWSKSNWSVIPVMVEQTYSYSLVLVSSGHCERNHQGTALPLKNCSRAYFWFLHLVIPASSLCHEQGWPCARPAFKSSLFSMVSCLWTFCSWNPALKCLGTFPVLRASLLAWREALGPAFWSQTPPKTQ